MPVVVTYNNYSDDIALLAITNITKLLDTRGLSNIS